MSQGGLKGKPALLGEDGEALATGPANGKLGVKLSTDKQILAELQETNRLLRKLVLLTNSGLRPKRGHYDDVDDPLI